MGGGRKVLHASAAILGTIAMPFLALLEAGAQDVKTTELPAVAGIVRDSSAPLAGASVSIGAAATVVTTTSGRFRIVAQPGSHGLHVRALGYTPFDTVVTVRDAMNELTIELTIELTKFVPRLERVTVTASGVAKPFRYANTSKFDEFYERRATAVGATFLTREDIERANKLEAYELLQNVPGVQISGRSGQAPLIRLARCAISGASPFAPIGKIDLIDKDGVEKKGTLQLFINGLRVEQPLTTLAGLKPDDIEALEFYRGVAQLPAAARGDGCAALFIWTRYSVGSVLKDSTP